MKRLRITEELIKDIKENYDNFPPSYFADKHNRTVSAIHTLACKLKVTYIHQLNRDEREIVNKYNNGLSIKNLKKEFGHDGATLIELLKKNGCNIRDKRDSHLEFSVDESYFEKINSHEKAYWLGFIYADGNIYKNKLQIALANKDICILNRFKECIKSEHKLYKDTNCMRFTVRSPKIVSDLNKLGVFPQKSLTLKFPSENQVEKKYINSFLLGYFDGDGWITYRKYKNKYNSNVKQWGFNIISTLEFCESAKPILDLAAGRVGYIRKEKRSKENVWYLSYSGSCMKEKGKITPKKIFDFIYKNIKKPLNRKKQIFNKILC